MSTIIGGTVGGVPELPAPQTTVGLSATRPDLPGRPSGSPHPPGAGAARPAREQVVGTERAVIQQTRAAFADYQAAQEAIQAQTVAVQANQLALEGNRAEQSVGTRTIIEVLNAEQDLLNSQVALVTAKRDAYVAGFQLLNAMGQAQAQDLGLDGGPLYDPLGNYRRVANNWNDWASDPRTRRSRRARSARRKCRPIRSSLRRSSRADRSVAADPVVPHRWVDAVRALNATPGRDSAAALSYRRASCSRPAANRRWKTSSPRSRK